MRDFARVSSKGQITIPKAVREALGLKEGDAVLFKVDGQRAVIARTPDFIELAGTVEVPLEKRGTPWDQVLKETRRKRAAARR
jgi:AbrB family looped-hinge helix DNA binding protein